ncbi:MAG: molybdate ABC transporter permease subunit [Lachnospiraceae bacterium]|nr:molybdate ABC transporter permease subunit [Lachnospiraceae bacterium]
MDRSPLLISVKIAAVSTVITFILGTIAAKAVVSMKRFKFIIDTVFSLPLVLPPTVVGFFLLILFGKNTAFGSFLYRIGINIVFTWQGAVIAAVVVSFPIMYRTMRGAFEQVDKELIDMARLFGCGRINIIYKVWIPLSWPVIVSGVTLSFARALGEFGATIMIAGNIPGKTRTMSVAVYTAMQSGDRTLAYSWVAVILVMSACLLLVINYLTEKKYK